MTEKFVVLAGGPSCERDISLLSGKAVLEALAAKGYSVTMMDPAGDFLGRLKAERPDIAFLALHGTFGEDGTIQRLLEEAGIPYTGSGPAASEDAFDKARTQEILHAAGIRIPRFIVLRSGREISVAERWEPPFVVKPTKAGSSVGVSLVFDRADGARACEEAFRYSDSILVEQYIAGRELTAGILGNEVLPIVEVKAEREFYDYEAKYRDDRTRYECPAALGAETAGVIRAMALKVHEALGCEIMSRVDFILDENTGKAYVLEINTIPGLTGKSLLPKAARASGIDFPELCVKILRLSGERCAARLRTARVI